MAGRKSKWDELDMNNKLILVEGWCRDGATDKDIMERLNISHDLFYQWKREKTEFAETLKKGKEVIDRQVENALLKRALGYRYDEVTREDGIITKVVTKEVTPDTTAQIFWLKNRKREAWRDKQDIEHSGTTNSNVNIDLSNVSTEDLKKLLK